MKKVLLIVFLCIIGCRFSDARDFEISLSGQYVSMILPKPEYADWKNDAISNNGVIDRYTKEIYEKFEDDFDFIIFQLNEPTLGDFDYYGKSFSVSNDVSGIGMDIFNFCEYFGSKQRLQQVIHMPCYEKGIVHGPFLHEILHRWGQYAFQTIDLDGNDYTGHWGLTGGSTNGQLGGFRQDKLMVDDPEHPYRYSVSNNYFGENANHGNSVPYNDIELYLMGMLPLDSVAEFSLFNAVDSFSYDGETDIISIYSDSVTKYNKELILSEIGERAPSSSTSQKDFKALFVIVSDRELTCEEREEYDKQISQFCLIGDDDSYLYNFWEATHGMGTFTTGDVSKSLKKKNEGLTMLFPSAPDDTLELFSSYTVEWDSESIESVSIDLYQDGCFLKNLTVDYPAEKGSFVWNLEDSDLDGLSDLRFKITDMDDKDIYSFSSNPFSVRAKRFNISGAVYDSLDNPIADAFVTFGHTSPKLEASNENQFVSAYIVEFTRHYTRQPFVPTSSSLNGLDLVLAYKGTPDMLTVGIMDSLEKVLVSVPLSYEQIAAWQWISIPFSQCVNVIPGKQYYIFMEHANVSYGDNCYYWALDEAEHYVFRLWSGDGTYVKTDEQGRYSFSVMDRWSGSLSAFYEGLSFEKKSFEDITVDFDDQDFHPVKGVFPTSLDDALLLDGVFPHDAYDLFGRRLPASSLDSGRRIYPSVILGDSKKYLSK